MSAISFNPYLEEKLVVLVFLRPTAALEANTHLNQSLKLKSWAEAILRLIDIKVRTITQLS